MQFCLTVFFTCTYREKNTPDSLSKEALVVGNQTTPENQAQAAFDSLVTQGGAVLTEMEAMATTVANKVSPVVNKMGEGIKKAADPVLNRLSENLEQMAKNQDMSDTNKGIVQGNTSEGKENTSAASFLDNIVMKNHYTKEEEAHAKARIAQSKMPADKNLKSNSSYQAGKNPELKSYATVESYLVQVGQKVDPGNQSEEPLTSGLAMTGTGRS